MMSGFHKIKDGMSQSRNFDFILLVMMVRIYISKSNCLEKAGFGLGYHFGSSFSSLKKQGDEFKNNLRE